ncbi:Palmitoyltransferase [Hexamita inflata]|uniref:Palmitoyltransferase n=1 Tax=Hexamita inflata TaxID=28002 RepID=A0AA86RAE7_9EUKA|nr:Palmitoyltransferase [Hexamita inflata]
MASSIFRVILNSVLFKCLMSIIASVFAMLFIRSKVKKIEHNSIQKSLFSRFVHNYFGISTGFFVQVTLVFIYLIITPILVWNFETENFACSKTCKQILMIALPRKQKLLETEFIVSQSHMSFIITSISSIISIIVYVKLISKPKPSVSSTSAISQAYFTPKFKNDEQKTVFYQLLNIFSPHCRICNNTTPFSAHSQISDICVPYYDHTCPWVGRDVASNSLLGFIQFVGFTSVQALILLCITLLRLICQTLYLIKIANFKIKFYYLLPALAVNIDNNQSSLYFALILALVVILVSGGQFVFQILKLSRVVTLPYQDKMKEMKNKDFYLSTIADYVEVDGKQYQQLVVLKQSQNSQLKFENGLCLLPDNQIVYDLEFTQKIIKNYPISCGMMEKINWLKSQTIQE